MQRVHRVLAHHRRSVAQALLDLFPEIGLEKLKFRGIFFLYSPQSPIYFCACIFNPLKSGSWHKKESKRNLFISYAKTHGFDPLHPENWYSQPTENIKSLMVTFSFSISTSVPYYKTAESIQVQFLFPWHSRFSAG